MKTDTEKMEENHTNGKSEENSVISYRMKCSESGNGLSHYIMYGDVPEEMDS